MFHVFVYFLIFWYHLFYNPLRFNSLAMKYIILLFFQWRLRYICNRSYNYCQSKCYSYCPASFLMLIQWLLYTTISAYIKQQMLYMKCLDFHLSWKILVIFWQGLTFNSKVPHISTMIYLISWFAEKYSIITLSLFQTFLVNTFEL